MSQQPLPDPGWYPDPEASGEFRWWDGAAWAPYADEATRRSALALAIGHQVAMGGVVADRGDDWAVITVFRPAEQVSHVVHVILTLLTCGLWLVVWIVLALVAKPARHHTYRLEVDRMARVSLRELK